MEPWQVSLVVFGVVAVICLYIRIRYRERK